MVAHSAGPFIPGPVIPSPKSIRVIESSAPIGITISAMFSFVEASLIKHFKVQCIINKRVEVLGLLHLMCYIKRTKDSENDRL